MTELDGRHGAERLDEIGDAPISRNMTIAVDAGAMMRLAAARFDRAFFTENDAASAHGKAAEVDQLPLLRTAVVRRVLAHRGTDDAIAGEHRTQLDRREQQRCVTNWVVHLVESAVGLIVAEFHSVIE